MAAPLLGRVCRWKVYELGDREIMGNAVVTLKKGEGRTLKSGGMWVYDNEIESAMGHVADGDIVAVHDFDGYPMGNGN